VEAGRVGATATMDVVRATPAYQADLAAARVELAGTQPSPDANACTREEKILWPSVLAGLKSK
jgi:hypothetical protein